MLKHTALGFVFIVGAFSGTACTCIHSKDYSIEKEFNETDLVFSGKMIAVDTVHVADSIFGFSKDELWYTFKISEKHRGKLKTNTVRVRSGITNADDCKFEFKLNREYVVYANHPFRDEKRKDRSIFETSNCTNTDERSPSKIKETKGLN